HWSRRQRRAHEGNHDARVSAFGPVPLRFLQVSAAARSGRQSESFRFNFNKQAADRSEAPVEVRILHLLQIDEKASDPWGKMVLEELLLCVQRRIQASAGQTSHDFAKDGGMIFRLSLIFSEGDAKHT